MTGTGHMTGTSPAASRDGGAVSPLRILPALPWVLAAAVVGCQIAYPLVDGAARSRLTVVTVVLFFLASVIHAATTRGPTWAAGLVGISIGTGFVVEAVGVRTGYPFGTYDYGDSLGPSVAGVPVVVPLAWAMMTYPALLVGRRLVRRRLATRWVPVVGGWALASWDLFLDPQMVDAGHWRWQNPSPGLPGLDAVPATNFAGWFLVAVVLVGACHHTLPDGSGGRRDEGVPGLLYLWTFCSSVLAHAVFFGNPVVALVGGAAMGVVAVPYAHRLWRDRP